ncbi:hypothetical protein [Streptomyces sp. NBC_01314]|uniref:hypothetical protein n=1 Tax=Streptomyces sp. NBC_01314 TaxID=2903821 RepID=UPI0030866367|nr:hypothetical protein OG622_01455 [Streptomyces sp. NBC_01314]
MREFVRENLVGPRIGPGAIAEQHRISARYVTSLFLDLGTSPAASVREQRLEQAQMSLGGPLRREFGIAAVAVLCGLTDTVTRAFRRAYGVTPAESRSGGHHLVEPAAASSPVVDSPRAQPDRKESLHRFQDR